MGQVAAEADVVHGVPFVVLEAVSHSLAALNAVPGVLSPLRPPAPSAIVWLAGRFALAGGEIRGSRRLGAMSPPAKTPPRTPQLGAAAAAGPIISRAPSPRLGRAAAKVAGSAARSAAGGRSTRRTWCRNGSAAARTGLRDRALPHPPPALRPRAAGAGPLPGVGLRARADPRADPRRRGGTAAGIEGGGWPPPWDRKTNHEEE